MGPISTTDQFLDAIGKSGLFDPTRLEAQPQEWLRGGKMPADPQQMARWLIRAGLLTSYQAKHLLKGKWRNFLIAGKYKLLEMLGSGGMGRVFLCEHVHLHRKIAIKVLPPELTGNPVAVERFYREARAIASLDHPNIVKAHDVDCDNKVHFLVMEYVEGINLLQLVKCRGPLEIPRAVNYV